MEQRFAALAKRGKSQPPPPRVIWESLCDLLRSEDRRWFDALPGESPPRVIAATKPFSVTWSSIWLDRPELTIEFHIEAAGDGSYVTWTLVGPERSLDEQDVRRRRYRLDQLINGQLRDTFDQ